MHKPLADYSIYTERKTLPGNNMNSFVISYILSYAKCFIDFLLCYWVFSWFFDKRRDKISKIIFIIGLAALILQGANVFKITWLNTSVSISCTILISHILFEARWQAKFISSIIIVLLFVICEFFPLLILATIMNENVSIILSTSLNSAAFSLISTGFFFVLVKIGKGILLKKYAGNSSININNNGWAILFPVISIVLVYYSIYVDSFIVSSRQGTIVQSLFYIAILVANLGFFFGETGVEKKYLLHTQLNELRFEQSKAEAILKLKDNHIREMKCLVHDYDVQLNGLKTMILEGHINGDEGAFYAEQLKENLQEANHFLFVESKPLQLILNQANDTCITHGIEFIADIRYASFAFMTFPDIFSLFENMLDNAINACLNMPDKSKAKIKLQMLKSGAQILILISNTYSKREQSGKLYRKPRATKEHGNGLHCIKSIVRKYCGTIHIDQATDFKILISLPIDTARQS